MNNKNIIRIFSALIYVLAISLAYSDENGLFVNEGQPENKIVKLDIPSQNLAQALAEFGKQTPYGVVARFDDVDGIYSSPIMGPFKASVALKILLSHSQLEFKYIEKSGVFVIYHRTVAAQEPRNSASADGDSIPIEEILVSGTNFPSRYGSISNSHMHSGVSSFDSARYINAITSQLIEDQQSLSIVDSLQYSSGVLPGDGIAFSNDDFYMRGFPRHAIYLEGFRIENSNATKILPEIIERVDVIKGPSTLFYGQAEPGGVVNIVRKRPERVRKVLLSTGAGTDGLSRTSIDITGTCCAQNSPIAHRLIYASQNRDRQRNLHDLDTQLGSLGISWALSGNQFIDLTYDNQESHFRRLPEIWNSEAAVVNDGDIYQDIPEFKSNFQLASLDYSYYLKNNWLLQLTYFNQREMRAGYRGFTSTFIRRSSLGDQEELFHRFATDGLRLIFFEPVGDTGSEWEPGVTIDIFPIENTKNKTQFYKASMEGEWSHKNLTHYLRFGLDAYKGVTSEYLDLARINHYAVSEVEHYHGHYRELLTGLLAFDSYKDDYRRLSYSEGGVYVQDNIAIGEKWLVSLGGRLLSASGHIAQAIIPHQSHAQASVEHAESISLADVSAFSKQLGIVYKAFNYHNIYFNYSEAVKSNFQIDNAYLENSKPETSHQIEFGIKSQIWDGRMNTVASVFNIEKENVLQIYYQTGNEDSDGRRIAKGFNFDYDIQVGQNLNVIGALMYLDTAIVSNDRNNGNQLGMASQNSASLFLNYQASRGRLSGLQGNIGLIYVGKRYVSDENNQYRIFDGPIAEIDQHAVMNVGMAYHFGLSGLKSVLRLNVDNVADTRYIHASERQFREIPGDGRNYRLSLDISI